MTTQPSPRRERRAAGSASGTRLSRAGRNLPVATGVGLSLGAVILASLLFRKEGFLGVLIVAACLAVWELRDGLGRGKIRIPLVPSIVGAVTMIAASFVGGGQALTVCFGLTCISVLLWRVSDGLQDAIRDIAGGIFVAAYVPLLASFSSLLLAAPDGAKRVIVFIVVTICSDIGGFAVGVLVGRHPMVPSISPKKSWEGAAGSVLACVSAGVVTVMVILGGTWWAGAALGLAVAVSATVGDLTESMIKRDLGVKDMGNILPGHGGFMDRMDSLLLSAPVAWALLTLLVPFTVVPVA
ncbi:MAG: phosphatidate cytidylyltransferase [Actinobacteria bacterium]|nr:phosphatidate cytidylyltransferase [Actinomycetota bacterium]